MPLDMGYIGSVLVACEYSATVRTAFEGKGWFAMSCDILDSELPGNHYKGSVLDILHSFNWDMLIGFPPCTYVAYSSNAHWNNPGRVFKRLEGIRFFAQLWESGIPHICLENPVGVIDHVVHKHTQIIHPYYFGESEMKRTCLWLKNLPPLVHADRKTLFEDPTHVEKPNPVYIDKSGKKRYRTDAINSGHERSRFFSSVAQAMSEQWTQFYLSQNI